MEYQTYNPSNALAEIVQCYWTLDGSAETVMQRQTIVPDGCMEMIFHHGDLYRQCLPGGGAITQPRCFVIGQLSRPLEIEPTGRIGIFSVRFHPDGFSPFASIPVEEIEDTAVSLETFFGDVGKKLAAEVVASTAIAEKIKVVENFLLNTLQQADAIDRVTRAIIEAITSNNGKTAINGLADQYNVSQRKMERDFKTRIGLSPKQLSQVVRLLAIFQKMLSGPVDKFTTLAHDGQYFDQAHFTKEFKRLTGVTPKQYHAESMRMSALFYKNE